MTTVVSAKIPDELRKKARTQDFGFVLIVMLGTYLLVALDAQNIINSIP
jgi:hypothetical protein